MSIELIFWLTVLGVWFIVVVKGLSWLEGQVDNYLDRYFAKHETNDEADV